MKRIFSVVLTVAILCSTLLPVAYAENTAVTVAPTGDTLIELEEYYPVDIVEENANASGGFLVKAANVRPFTGEDERTGDDFRFVPVVRTITLDVAEAGKYKIEWVANERCNPDSSAMTLAVNDADVFKVIAEGQHLGSNPDYQYKMFTQDGRAQEAVLEDASVGEDAGYTVDVHNDPVTLDYVMKKYTADVELTQGTNTIDIYVTGGVQYGFYNFVMDYVKIFSDVPAISTEGATRIEIDDKYYQHGAARGWDTSSVVTSDLASGGSYIHIENPPTGWGTNSLKERTFNIYAYEAGNYDVTFVAGPSTHGEYKSKVELLINGTEIIDSTETLNTDPTPGVDLPTADLDMKLYKVEDVALNEGTNTFTIKITGDTHFNVPYFALDYLEFAPAVVEDTRVVVSELDETVIELEEYYPFSMYSANQNASGGAVARINDVQPDFIKVEGSEDYRNGSETENGGDQRRFNPIVRTITLNVSSAGKYTIEWIANKNVNADSSPITLAVNDEDVFRVISNGGINASSSSAYAGQTLSRDGRGNIVDDNVFLNEQSPSVDTGWALTLAGTEYRMQKYTSTVELTKGDNTISIYFCGGVNYTNYNLAMDCVTLKSTMQSVSSTQDATFELEEYYPSSMYSANENASGGAVARINDIQPDFIKVEGSEDYRNGSETENGGDQRRFNPIVRTITFNVEEAGNYKIEWIANKNVNGDSSPITLAVNDEDVFRVISNGGISASSSSAYAGQTLSRDGRGTIVDDNVFLNEQSPSVDAGWALTIAGVEYKMQKYTSVVSLEEGINTISVYFCGGVNYTNYNLAMDCVTLESTMQSVSSTQNGTIEFEEYYPEAMYSANESASGGAVARINDSQPAFITTAGTDDSRTDGISRRYTPIQRTITFNVEEAGNYEIEWIANKNVNADSSPITLAVNDKDVFKVISNGQVPGTATCENAGKTISIDGRGNVVDDNEFLNGQSQSVDAGWSLTINNLEYKMQKYTATVALREGKNTISVYFCGGIQYTNYNLAMDCVNISYVGEIVDSVVLNAETHTATATVCYDTTYTGKVIIAVYNIDGMLIGMNSADIDADYAIISAPYSGTAASVKVFVWNSFEACKPLTAAKTPTIQ